MYRKNKMQRTSFSTNESTEGETLEEKLNRIVNNREPIEDGAPIIFTMREDGVRPEYNPRTDRFEVAVEAMDAVTKTEIAKREGRIAERKEKLKKVSGGENEGNNPSNTEN